MKDYLVCFKKVGYRVEIGVRVGGLPRDVLRVSGTSAIHYEIIRRALYGCGWDTMCACVSMYVLRRGRKRWKARKRPRAVRICICFTPVCVCDPRWGGLLAAAEGRISQDVICRERGTDTSSLQMLSSIQGPRLTSTHTLIGLFVQPRGRAVLRTWYGIYKKIFVNGGPLAFCNGPFHAAVSHPAICGRRAGIANQLD